MPDEDDDWHQCNVALFHELQELKGRKRTAGAEGPQPTAPETGRTPQPEAGAAADGTKATAAIGRCGSRLGPPRAPRDPRAKDWAVNTGMDQQLDPEIRCEPPLSPEVYFLIWCWFRRQEQPRCPRAAAELGATDGRASGIKP